MRPNVVGVAVVGYGYWGPNLARNFGNTEGAQMVAVSDTDAEKLLIGRRRHPSIITTTDFRELLTNDRVDAIAIATPVHTHYDLAFAALKAGKHVFVEKPLAQTSEQVKPSNRGSRAAKSYFDGGSYVSLHSRGTKNSGTDRKRRSRGYLLLQWNPG